jgi:hypothetical protein
MMLEHPTGEEPVCLAGMMKHGDLLSPIEWFEIKHDLVM